MAALLYTFLTGLFISVLFFAVIRLCFCRNMEPAFKNKLYISFALSTLISLAIMFLLLAALEFSVPAGTDIVKKNLGIFAAIPILSGLWFYGRFMQYKIKDEANAAGNGKRAAAAWHGLAECGIAGGAALLLEVFFFNYLFFTPLFHGLKPSAYSVQNAEAVSGAYKTQNGIFVNSSNSVVLLKNINARSVCLTLDGSGMFAVGKVKADIEDDNISDDFYTIGTFPIESGAPRTMTLPIASSGNLKAVRLTFDNGCAGLFIRNFSFNNPCLYLSPLRFYLLFLLSSLVILILRLKLWRVNLNTRSTGQTAAIIASVLLLCLFAALCCRAAGGNKDIRYPLTSSSVSSYGCYIQQFDAFMKGRLDLDIPVDPKLTALQNPYDTAARSNANVQFSWDRSFYNGKYYSYFGVVPVLTVYFPYYLLRHALPTDMMAGLILSLGCILAVTLLILEIAAQLRKKINLLLLLLTTAAAVFADSLYMLEVCSDFYYIPYLSGILFLSLFLFFALLARRKTGGRQAAFFALCGLCFALIVGSRPVMGVYGLLMLPLCVEFLRNPKTERRSKAIAAASFAIPVVVCGALLMWYNAARFGSPFEFGQHYQLTLDNMRYNKITLRTILPALWYFFFQLPHFTPQFPFFHPALDAFHVVPSFKLADPIVGAFAYPLILSIFTVKYTPAYKKSRFFRVETLILLICAAVAAIVDFSSSGTSYRYVCDLTPMLSLLGAATIFSYPLDFTVGKTSAVLSRPASKRIYIAVVAALALTILIGAAMIFDNERDFILQKSPAVYADIQRVFMFW